MCGIAGILHFNNEPVLVAKLKQMTDVLIHRGPDGEGQWINEEKNVGFGHRRLSIIDLSDAGKQPMHFKNQYTITFNGEIYNYVELKKILQQKGYSFNTETDTEVILAAYDFWGKKCLDEFDGMFAFAIWDQAKKELFCARDRFGEKPFYYYKDKNYFVFASEMKALFSVDIIKEINRKRVFEYLLFLTVENPYNRNETFFKNINQLPPSSFLLLNQKSEIKIEKYWDLDISTTFIGTDGEAEEKFKELFFTSIKHRLRSDVPVGSSLSGGLDSSSIVCYVNQLLGEGNEQHVFSARFPEFIKDEGKHIEEVVGFCKKATIIQHEVFPTEESMLSNLKKIMYHQEEPFGSSSIAAQYEVMKLASDAGVKVLLDGQGADEMMAGYTTFFETHLKQTIRNSPLKYHKEKTAIKDITGIDVDVLNLEGILSTFLYNNFKYIGNKRRGKLKNDSDFFLGIHPELVAEFKSVDNPMYSPPNIKKHLKFMLLNRGLNELLRYADRNSMANSIEVRLPFLSHKLVEFVFTLPEHYFIRNGWTKFILRQSMEGILPQKIQWRRDKIGYEPPQANWMENKELVEMTKSAQQKLVEDKILSDKNHDVNWHHLMLGMMYEK
jgi:asparagine synthase (glutamine-hydrolysing)